MKTFIWLIRQFGLKIALDNVIISFAKWFTGAKRIQLTYRKKGVKKKNNYAL